MRAIFKEKYFFYLLLAFAGLVCAMIFWPFVSVIVVSMAVAVGVYPIFKWIRKYLTFGNYGFASLFTVIFIGICIGVPLYFIGMQVFAEAQGLYKTITAGGTGFKMPYLSSSINIDIQSRIGDIAAFVSTHLAGVFASTLNTLLSFVLVILSLFYFLKDGERWKSYILQISPLSNKHDTRILSMLELAVNGVIRGYILIALAQGVLMAIGLWIFGVPNPALWAVLAAIASMIPTIGTATISVPSIIYLYLTGNTAGAIGLAIWAATAVGLIDNLLSPIVVGKKLDLPPIVILFAVLGGVAIMGPVGILLGPLAVSLFYTLAIIYQEDFRSK